MGKLMDLIVLDTRNYDRSITTLGTLYGMCGILLRATDR